MEKVFSIIRKTYDRKPTDDLKDLDVNTPFWVKLCLSHFKLQFILGKIIHKTYDLSRINLRNLWSNYFGQLKSWSKIKWRSQVCPRLIGISLCGENHLFCVIELFILWNPKPTSLPTRCYVWEASVVHQSKLGKTKLNGIWKHAISKNCNRIDGEPMEFEWTIFTCFTILGVLTEIQKMMAE